MKKLSGEEKKVAIVVAAALVIILVVTVWFMMRGRISQDEWDSVQSGMTKETVVEYLGKPKEKVIDQKEIFDSYKFLLIAAGAENISEDMQDDINMADEMSNYSNIEMYTYKMKSNEHHIYFSNEKVIWKK